MRMREVSVSLAALQPDAGRAGVIAFAEIMLAGDDGQGNELMLTMTDVRLVRLRDGRLDVALPQRVKVAPCRSCRRRNGLAARYCSNCGTRQEDQRQEYIDVVQPRNQATREWLVANMVSAVDELRKSSGSDE